MEIKKSTASGPFIISFDVTYKCTLRCLHCFNLSGESNEEELSDDELLKVSEQIVELAPSVVCICGGEPLLRKEIVYKCCELITSKSNRNITVNMVTNGELMTKEVAQQLFKAGFTNIQVSLDGANAETHDWLRNKQGVFDKAVNAIKYIKEAGLKVGVACTPNLKNLKQVDDTIKLCEELGVDDFRMQPLMPLGRASENLTDYMPQYEDYRDIARHLKKLNIVNGIIGKMRVEWGDPVDHLIRYRYKDAGCNLSLGISAYGYLTVSPYLPATLGNVRKHTLAEYWEKGLSYAWNIPVIKYLAGMVKSTDKLGLDNNDINIPKIYFEDNIDLDLFEDDVFNMKVEDILNKKI